MKKPQTQKILVILFLPILILITTGAIFWGTRERDEQNCLPGFTYSLCHGKCINDIEFCSHNGYKYEGTYPFGECKTD